MSKGDNPIVLRDTIMASEEWFFSWKGFGSRARLTHDLPPDNNPGTPWGHIICRKSREQSSTTHLNTTFMTISPQDAGRLPQECGIPIDQIDVQTTTGRFDGSACKPGNSYLFHCLDHAPRVPGVLHQKSNADYGDDPDSTVLVARKAICDEEKSKRLSNSRFPPPLASCSEYLYLQSQGIFTNIPLTGSFSL
jgi:hypothetical protein